MVLADVYRSLLQQATAMARVAQAKLAFERQEVPPAIVRMDYWSEPRANPTSGGANGAERQGLTGSARLLADIYQLDQYAFDTNKRKLAISKTVSLAQMAPAEFQRFRETGVIVFNTPMQLFDRDFPGHYLRLIRRVRTSVIALVPTTEGIRATLSNTGISRVVVGPEMFQTLTIRRDPETVALSVPIGSTGVFEMDEVGEMYLPFEGHGVDSTWELRLPRASNRFDFRTLADVLITIEYSALNSFDYANQVIQQLKPDVEADRAFSFRQQFANAWYDLHNPQLIAEPQRMVVQFRIGRDDFPSNLDDIRMRHVMLYVARADGMRQEVAVGHLKLKDAAGVEVTGGAARTIDGTISTRRGNGSAWLPLIGGGAATGGRTPFGTWELSLRNSNAAEAQQLQDWLKDEQIEDILLVITYAGRTPAWPA
jgi:Tc toxin complex TcA C-terminal TcB-binding domain